MRTLDVDAKRAPKNVQFYLSPAEARTLVAELSKLLQNPEASEHFHLFSEDGHCELSCSVVTRNKLAGTGYTAEERRAFGAWKPVP